MASHTSLLRWPCVYFAQNGTWSTCLNVVSCSWTLCLTNARRCFYAPTTTLMHRRTSLSFPGAKICSHSATKVLGLSSSLTSSTALEDVTDLEKQDCRKHIDRASHRHATLRPQTTSLPRSFVASSQYTRL
eukprot:Rmarinus@m.22585